MSGMYDTCEKSYLESVIPSGIPVSWIREQIKKNPGRHASSWKYLIDIWDEYFLKASCSQQPIENKDQSSDGYVRMHKDPTAAQKFWRNE